MVYQYDCPKCSATFDVVKSYKEMTSPEHCPECKELAVRKFFPSRVYFCKTAVQHAEYNPGLGVVTKNAQHRAEVAKSMGVVEIGNQDPESMHKNYETEREKKTEQAWSETLREACDIAATPSAIENLTGANNV